MQIRNAHPEDYPRIAEVYDAARAIMRSRGNRVQWVNGYPSRELTAADIRAGNCFVGTDENGVIRFVFTLVPGDDPTYRVIENGCWLNDRPYGTIHRLGSDGTVKGVFALCFDFCRSRTGNLRADTHECNLAMRHQFEKCGFVQCGIIREPDGSPRVAYQYSEE